MAAAEHQPGHHGLGWRHTQVVVMFLAACSAISIRTCLSVAVVDMTASDSGDGQHRFEWSPTEKSAVLGSFLWGYMWTQTMGGALSSRGRATLILSSGLGLSGALTATLPLVAVAGGSTGVTAVRVATGVLQGVIFPTIYCLIGQWVPPDERSRAGSLLLASQPGGNVLALALSGIVARAWGWPAIFYVFGGSSIVTAIAVFLVSADSPNKHPRISAAERCYITKAISAACSPQVKRAVPWCRILTSPALLSLLVAHVGYLWGYWVLIACTPSYFNNLLDVGIEWNGLLSATPQVAMVLGSFFFGWLGDLVESRHWLSLTRNRKLFNSIGSVGPGALCILVAALGPANPTLAVALLVVTGGLISASFTGALICFVDIAPNFSGINFGLGNTIGSFISAFAPYAEGVFVDRSDPMPGWGNVFYLSAAVYLVTNLVWCLIGSAEVQPWNEPSTCLEAQRSSSGKDNPTYEEAPEQHM